MRSTALAASLAVALAGLTASAPGPFSGGEPSASARTTPESSAPSSHIDNHGRPFRTTPVKGLPRYWHRTPSDWVPMTTSDDKTDAGD